MESQDPGQDANDLQNEILSRILSNEKLDFSKNPAQIARKGYFDQNFLKVDQVLCTPSLFPLIHPRGSLRVKGTWMEECLRMLHVLIHFRKETTCIGLKFTAFDP